MRIKEFTIENFKNIGISQPCRIVFPTEEENGTSDFITIIGENNVGKSTIFEALRLFLPDTGIANIPTLEMFPMKTLPSSEEKNMRLTLILNDFNEQDREHRFLKPYIYNDEIKIKRVWSNTEQKDSEVPFQVYIPTLELLEIPSNNTFNTAAFQNVSSDLESLYRQYCTENNITNGTITAKKKADFIEFVYLHNSSLLSIGEPIWQDNPNGFASNIRSVLPKVIYVPAVKLIEDEADSSKNKSAASQLTSILFEEHLNGTSEIQNFQLALQELQKIFNGDSRNEQVQILEDRISKKLQRLLNIEANVDFATPEVMQKLHLNSTLLLKYNNLVTTPNQHGNGVQRMLILSLLELMAEQLTNNNLGEQELSVWKKPFLFMIEEPEIYLHPHLQRKMRDSLVQISKHPLAQVICTSHSENFINLADRHQGIVILKQENNVTSTIQVTDNIYSGMSAVEKRNRMRMLLNFNPSTLEAFFARRVILVEGDCEIASVKAIKDKLIELNPEKKFLIENVLQEVSIISCNGKLTQKAYFEVLSHFNIKPYLIHDLDGESLYEGRNLNIFDSIQSEEYRLTHSPNFELDIFGQSWTYDKPWKATNLIYNSYETYHEKLIRFFKFVIGEDVINALELKLTSTSETVLNS